MEWNKWNPVNPVNSYTYPQSGNKRGTRSRPVLDPISAFDNKLRTRFTMTPVFRSSLLLPETVVFHRKLELSYLCMPVHSYIISVTEKQTIHSNFNISNNCWRYELRNWQTYLVFIVFDILYAINLYKLVLAWKNAFDLVPLLCFA